MAGSGHGSFARVDPIWALGQADIPGYVYHAGEHFISVL